MANHSNTDNAFSSMSITKLTYKNYGFWVDKARAILRNRVLWGLATVKLSPAPMGIEARVILSPKPKPYDAIK